MPHHPCHVVQHRKRTYDIKKAGQIFTITNTTANSQSMVAMDTTLHSLLARTSLLNQPMYTTYIYCCCNGHYPGTICIYPWCDLMCTWPAAKVSMEGASLTTYSFIKMHIIHYVITNSLYKRCIELVDCTKANQYIVIDTQYIICSATWKEELCTYIFT